MTKDNKNKESLLEFSQRKFKTVEYDKLAMQGKVKSTSTTNTDTNNDKKD